MNTVKALIEGVTQDLVAYLVEDGNIAIEQALDKVYSSAMFDKLSDENTCLYRESSAYVYSLLKDELASGAIIQSEI